MQKKKLNSTDNIETMRRQDRTDKYNEKSSERESQGVV